jgi:uncharacterized protein (TIGR00369 family)
MDADGPDDPPCSDGERATGDLDARGDEPAGEPTAVARELYDALPFHRAQGIEVLEVTADRARTRWPFDESLLGNPDVQAVHGGVVSALADLTGAVVFVGNLGRYTPTVDLRVDYLAHAGEADLTAEATVLRRAEGVGVADVVVESGEERCATARGVYKLGH